MRRSAVVLLSVLLALAACATAPSVATPVATPPAATPPPTDTLPPPATPQPAATPTLPAAATATTAPSPTNTEAATPATPMALSADGCPTPDETYHNDVLGVALAHSAEQQVIEPQYLGDYDYSVSLVRPDKSSLFQVGWLYEETPERMAGVMDELWAALEGWPVQRAPVTVGGVTGEMLWPVPGEVANTAIYLPVHGRLYRLLYAAAALDDTGRCLLAGLSFFPPTLTLEEQFLTQQAEAPAAARAAATPTPEIHDGQAVYHNAAYGFSFSYPIDRWTLVERAANPHVIALAYHELGIALRIGVARAGEDADLQLYGGAAGEFVPQGDAVFLGEPVGRSALVYEGVTRAVHYNETSPIARGDLLFSIALVSNRGYDQGAVVPDEVQAEVDRILETFRLDEAHS